MHSNDDSNNPYIYLHALEIAHSQKPMTTSS